MATFTATAVQSTVPAVYNAVGATVVQFERSIDGLAVSAGDVWQMAKIPKGARIMDMTLVVDNTGAAGVQSYTFGSLGDGGAAGRYIGTLSCVTSMVQRLALPSGFGYSYSAEDTIDLVWGTVTSGTAATATVKLTVLYTNQMPAI